jgi:hypothetical protein
VAGVLLEHVDEDVADAHGATVERHVPPQVVLVERVEPLVGRGDLRLPRGERLLDDGGVGDRIVEVRVLVVGAFEQAAPVGLPLQRPLELVVLHLR